MGGGIQGLVPAQLDQCRKHGELEGDRIGAIPGLLLEVGDDLLVTGVDLRNMVDQE